MSCNEAKISLTPDKYHELLLEKKRKDFRSLNFFVMDDTLQRCQNDPDLIEAISLSIQNQRIYYGDEVLPCEPENRGLTNVWLTPLRSFEILDYTSSDPKKTAVLNFANNHHVGGSPWSAGAQEESLCRCSTLYPCLKDAEPRYHALHRKQYEEGVLDYWGNDDIIYTTGVRVIKTDESAPRLLDPEKRKWVNIITCAAPQLSPREPLDREKFKRVMSRRIERILQVAKLNGNETIILGAFGCGAFHNPPELVAEIFKEQLGRCFFPRPYFAIFDREERPDNNLHTFERVFGIEAIDPR